jgi:hypothetical protein
MSPAAPAVADARVEMDGVPSILGAAGTIAFAGLADTARDALGDGLLLIALPAIRPEPGARRKRKHRNKETFE